MSVKEDFVIEPYVTFGADKMIKAMPNPNKHLLSEYQTTDYLRPDNQKYVLT
jgi:hypothetical protein